MITFTADKVRSLKRALSEATGESITFEGKEILVAYGEYLVEYLESQIGEDEVEV